MDKTKGVGIFIVPILMFSVFAFAFVVPASAQGQVPEPIELWSYVTAGNVTDVATGDLNGDGKGDVAAIDIWYEEGGTVHAISGEGGTLLWDNASVVGFAVAVGDIDGNPGNEVIVGGVNVDLGIAGLFAYDSDGNFLWFYPTGEYTVVWDMEIGDIDGDGTNDVVACSPYYDTLYAINGSSGNALPGWPVGHGAVDIAVGDLDGEDGMDVAAIGEGLAVFNSSGGLMWYVGELGGIAVEIGDVEGNGDNEVVIGTVGGVLAFSGTNDVQENPEHIYGFITDDFVLDIELGDLDGDLGDEVASIGANLSTLHAIDIDASEGSQEMWSYELIWLPIWFPLELPFGGEGLAIGDIDGDYKNEVVAGFIDVDIEEEEILGGGVAAFDGVDSDDDGEGDIVWWYETEDMPVDVEVGDINGDGVKDVIVATEMPFFTIHALATSKPTPVPQFNPIGLLALFGILAIFLVGWTVKKKR